MGTQVEDTCVQCDNTEILEGTLNSMVDTGLELWVLLTEGGQYTVPLFTMLTLLLFVTAAWWVQIRG